MSWQEQIKSDTSVWHGVIDYLQERIGDLTEVCCSQDASDKEVRAAQAGIAELQRMLRLPQMIASTVAQRSQADKSRGY